MAEILTLTKNTEKDIIKKIADTLKNSAVVIVPTDTVYGLICDGQDNRAKSYIYTLKHRPGYKPLIAFVKNTAQAAKIAYIQQSDFNFISRRWPGRNTFIFKSKIKSKYLVSDGKTIAIRIPDSNLITHLCGFFPYLASTSANLSFAGSCLSLDEINSEILNKIPLAIDAGKLSSRESAIWDMTQSPAKLVRGRALFVSSENDDRCYMAQIMLKHLIVNKSIDMVFAYTGSAVANSFSQFVIKTMEGFPMPTEGFSSCQLTDRLIISSDLIFVMEEKCKNIILQRIPESYDKIIVLDIPKPEARDISSCRKIKKIIAHRIKTYALTRIKNEDSNRK